MNGDLRNVVWDDFDSVLQEIKNAIILCGEKRKKLYENHVTLRFGKSEISSETWMSDLHEVIVAQELLHHKVRVLNKRLCSAMFFPGLAIPKFASSVLDEPCWYDREINEATALFFTSNFCI